jgi:hypothetical protein
MTLPNVFRSEEIAYNFNSKVQGPAQLHVIDYDAKYPKHLVIEVWKWFLENCETYHIDPSHYQFAEITKQDYTWNVDIYDSEDRKGGHFHFFSVYYDSKNKKILQAGFSID